MDMISNRPYLLRAFYDWIVDSQCTPVLVADPRHPRCKIPLDYEHDHEVVFNISPTAVRDLDISNNLVQFRASFNGIVHLISMPINAILALYADENNEGIFFEGPEEESESEATGSSTDTVTHFAFPSQHKPYQEDAPLAAHQPSSDHEIPKGKPMLRLVEID